MLDKRAVRLRPRPLLIRLLELNIHHHVIVNPQVRNFGLYGLLPGRGSEDGGGRSGGDRWRAQAV